MYFDRKIFKNMAFDIKTSAQKAYLFRDVKFGRKEENKEKESLKAFKDTQSNHNSKRYDVLHYN